MIRTLLYGLSALLALSLASRGGSSKTEPKAVAKLALAEYGRETKKSGSTILSPIGATKRIAAKLGVSTDRVASAVATVYYRENGKRNPLLAPGATDAAIRKAVLARRFKPEANEDGSATLGRWETVAASVAAGTGTRFSATDAKRVAADGYGETYIGRGTYAAAPSLRDEAKKA